jgi:hypothetical protein
VDHEHRWGRQQLLRHGSVRHCECGARLLVVDGHEPVITDPAREDVLQGIARDVQAIRGLPETEQIDGQGGP